MSGATYNNQREIFEKLLKKYFEYVKLYKEFCGSTKGVTPFEDFYWRYTYYSHYSNPENMDRRG